MPENTTTWSQTTSPKLPDPDEWKCQGCAYFDEYPETDGSVHDGVCRYSIPTGDKSWEGWPEVDYEDRCRAWASQDRTRQ